MQTLATGEVFAALDASPRGLSSADAAARRDRFGPNELPPAGRRGLWRDLVGQFNRPSQAVFTCRVCGFVEHADLNSSHNIAQRGWMAWVCGAQSQAVAETVVRSRQRSPACSRSARRR
ncbi:cation-transporting P-type ATPase [Streptomyces phaeochromogenes]|uniref:cation-transporting P-type ATPase n=1 Tax=Streptomyces phaeochromogenes TaxID=1923 RepID=UPI003869FF92|nr:cation-transporting P-type ATPase [Streptomyces phaeochromogenes]WSW11741.1 cation-transporting P-type ATPase [Streptomyces phaeochromogenes]